MKLKKIFKKSIWHDDYQRGLYNLYYDNNRWRYKENTKLLTTLTSQCARYSIQLVASLNTEFYKITDEKKIDQHVSTIFPALTISQYKIHFEPAAQIFESDSDNIVYGICKKERINSIRFTPVVNSLDYTPENDKPIKNSTPNPNSPSSTFPPSEPSKNKTSSFWTKILGK